MPRIREDVETEVPADEAPTPEVATERAPRSPRRPAPEGVTLGALDTPVRMEAPPAGASGAGRRGKPTSQKSLDLIASCKADPGAWFLMGEYLSPQNPTKTSVLGSSGLVFSNERCDHNGTVTFKRYASFPVVAEG